MRAYVDQQLADGLLWPDPLIQANPFIQRLIDGFNTLQPHLELVAMERAEALLQSHQRVRDAARHRGRYRVEPKLPPDILEIYIYLPKG